MLWLPIAVSQAEVQSARRIESYIAMQKTPSKGRSIGCGNNQAGQPSTVDKIKRRFPQ
jgi:hypothetical protein